MTDQSERSGDSPLTVSFQFIPGEIWVDLEDVAWEITYTDTYRVHFKRVATTDEDALEVARHWRRADV